MESTHIGNEQSTFPQFPGYAIQECLGRSQSANTYLAEDTKLKRHVVLKQVNPDLVRQDPDFLQYFEQEAQMLGKFKHDHIVEILSYHVDGDIAYIVMPHAEGGTLRELLQEEYPDGMTHKKLFLF